MTIAPDGSAALVVEDDPSLCDALARYLAHRGFVPTTARSAEAALEHLACKPYSPMLLDVTLPGMDGIDTVPAALARDPDLAILWSPDNAARRPPRRASSGAPLTF